MSVASSHAWGMMHELRMDAEWAVPPWSAGVICQPAVGGGGLRTEAAVLNNPAAGFMPAAGKAPRSGLLFTGREPHAIPGVTLPLPVILTAHRLRSPSPRPDRRLGILRDELALVR